MQRLETERLSLRWFTDDDAEFLLKLLNDPAFIRNIADRKVRDIPGAIEYIAKFKREGYDKLGFGVFLVELKATGEKIGICSLVKRPTLADVDIGFAFLPEYLGKGYAYESSEAVLNYTRNVLKFERIVGICDPGNTASCRLLEKLGLSLEERLLLDGRPTLLYGLNFK